MTQIIDHGKWVAYVPSEPPSYAPPGALFARRESDSVDWYDYVKAGTNFGLDTVKFTVWWQDAYNGYVVGAATRDETRLFPAGIRSWRRWWRLSGGRVHFRRRSREAGRLYSASSPAALRPSGPRARSGAGLRGGWCWSRGR